jgi:PAS domain S-box-containing protein
MDNIELSEIIDVYSVKLIMDNFYQFAHIPLALVDLKGNVLVSVGWQDICTKFHRVHPEACKHCIESDTELSSGVVAGEFKQYRCKNNMWDIVTPLMVGGQHVGNTFLGQFFFEDELLDYELFRSQAEKYGFKEEEYLAAFENVPRLSREAVDAGMSFLTTLANMTSQLSYSNIKLVQSLAERDALLGALQESEDNYRNIVETANEGIWILDAETRTTYVNEKMAEMLGCNREEMIGRLGFDFADEEGKAILKLNLEMRREGVDNVYEFKFVRKDGSYFWVLINAKAFFDECGKFSGSLGMFIDITERKKMEEALRLSNSYNRSLIEASLDPLVTIGRDGKITDVNSATEKVTGLSRNDLIGTDFSDYFTEPEKALVGYKHVFIDGEVRDYPLDIQHRDGLIIPVLYNASVYRDEYGEVIGVFAAARDITELKKAKEKIQSLANAVESSDDAIITMSLEGVIASWNKGAEQVYGYLAEEVLGKNISILEPDSLKGNIKQLVEKIKQGERIQHYETLRLRKDSTIINVSVTHSPVFDKSGELVDISIIARDITDKKIAEKLLQEKQMAEVANLTKNEFLAKISHELRTPLNSIIGFSDMLHEQMYGELNKKQMRYVENISKSGNHLLKLINNILDISKIEAGKMELSYKDFELASRLNMIQNILYPIADKKNIKIEINMDSKLGNICADEDKFVQIMYNLVDNAIKYSYKNNPVRIGARKKGDLVEITVKDSGLGVEIENQNKLFKPFSQIDSYTSEKSQGTGLGLSLVKQIVHMHGGYVWFRSNSNEGSIFAFAIPINNNKRNSRYVELVTPAK